MRAAILAVVTALVAGSAVAQTANLAHHPANGFEQVVVPLPDATWKSSARATGDPNLRIVDYFPAGQNITNWRERITLTFARAQARANWERIGDTQINLGGNTARACGETFTDLGRTNVGRLANVGYQVVACPVNRTNEHGELTLVAVVTGVEGLMVVERASISPPYSGTKAIDEATKRGWMQFLQTITTCDDRDAARKCPL